MEYSFPSFGIFKAIVTDNSSFFRTGKIKVRIAEFYNTAIDYNLTDDYNEEKFRDMLKEDVSAVVYTPFGGGYNHGFFALPQINSVGVVQFLNGNPNKPIWMGSFFNAEYDDENKIERTNVPNDNISKDKGASSDGITTDGKNIDGDEGTIIFRQKSTTKPSGDADNMNFDKQDTENMAVIDDEKLELYHFIEWDEKKGATKYCKIELYANNGKPQVAVKTHNYEDDQNPKSIGLQASDEEATIEFFDAKLKKASYAKVNKSGASLFAEDLNSGDNTEILSEPTTVSLTNKNASVTVEQDEVSVSSTSGKVRLSGTEVVIGSGGGYVVTSNSPNPIRMEDGSVLSKSTTVKA